ncbi:FeoA family protein [Consotaella salsifontis]|uniref:Ferrous iron transport protein A n=1 Tax=Consotaella salsifontis TaxID=1365950 RepID=A0A1T4NJQ0_9HYPH|nr:FeoA family protein [Consotaella salsifontis]SJZ78988.1 ferrous iron transport protein A [Consotaella salsifontis]
MQQLLSEIGVGKSAKVIGYNDKTSAYRRRLLAMGLTPGAIITVTRKAPLGDPIEIDLRGTALSVRKDEAKIVTVELA